MGPLQDSLTTDTAGFGQPLYQWKGYFSNDSLLSTGKQREYQGVAGDPVPYTLRGDDFFTSLLLLCFIVLCFSASHTQQFVNSQFKSFFSTSSHRQSLSETAGERRFQYFLVGMTCLLLAISTYDYITCFVAQTFRIDEYVLLALLFGCFALYFIFKRMLYQLVNAVFFSSSQTRMWRQVSLFITSMEGGLLFPIVMVQIYFELPLEKTVYYYGFVLFLAKILTFYKSWSIFFGGNGIFLRNFLYFCTLEITPLLILAGGIRWITDSLKIII